LARLSKHMRWFLYIKSPVRRFRLPWGASWTEFDLSSAQVKPVDILINKMRGKVAREFPARKKL
jgi:hypothetical protein